ncbi:MAG TPA: YbaB/EbfC family nucleoid-associated protein [Candidatus Acidoferrum sp.]|nr:YbaB/EbfC family nucleoid-associated protein [Candidatus Acidoferrum sp.]
MSDFKLPDLEGLMEAAQKIQGDVARMQEELASKTCDASAGGGMVTATVNGHYDLVALVIDKQVVDPADVAMLQDLVVAAVNQAVARMRSLAQAEMAKLTGGLNIPGLSGP